jgi:lipopolysaccharide biosynthesis regulator YciM
MQSGRLRAIKNEHLLAIREWTKIVNLHPEMLTDVVGLVRQSYQSLGRLSDYRKFLERCIELNNDVRLMMTLVDLLIEIGQPNQARNRLLTWMRNTDSLKSLTGLIESGTGGGFDYRFGVGTFWKDEKL